MKSFLKSAGLLGIVISFACGAEPPNSPPDFTNWTTGPTGPTLSTTSGSGFTTGAPPDGPGTTGSSGTGGSGGFDSGLGPSKPFGVYTKPVVTAATPPPPISGGTLAIIAAGHKAAVADSDLDQIVLVDLDAYAVTATTALEKGDEPGRVVEDGTGRLHISLRGAGAIATLDPSGTLLRRTPVCNHPRGLAYDRAADVVHVACAGGELIALPAGGGSPVRELKLDRDLRDIVVEGSKLLVSRFRAAEVLVVEADGSVSKRLTPPKFTSLTNPTQTFTAAVAWRMVAAPGGGVLLSLQEEQSSPIVVQPGGYGRGCGGGVVSSAVSVLRLDDSGWISSPLATTLPVDIAASADGAFAVVAGAGVPPPMFGPFAPPLAITNVTLPPPPTIVPPPIGPADAGRASSDAGVPPPCNLGGSTMMPEPPVVAVGFDATGRIVRQTREPALRIGDRVITLPGTAVADTGHEIFHLATFAGIACASCHPEGREDGHTWEFAGVGPRRTQTLGGGILGTEPFHWDGDMNNFDTLAHQVFNTRMSGPQLQPEHVQALANWIDKIPAWKPATGIDAAAIERGRALFAKADVGCTTCHAGAKMTNNATVNVGLGPVQVPSLRGVGYRAPLMHNGCASILSDRFDRPLCGGGDLHGHTELLTSADRSDLISHLESL